jgi:hypothetical protein
MAWTALELAGDAPAGTAVGGESVATAAVAP